MSDEFFDEDDDPVPFDPNTDVTVDPNTDVTVDLDPRPSAPLRSSSPDVAKHGADGPSPSKPAGRFFSRYPFWWDRAFIELGLTLAQRLLVVSAMRLAKDDGHGGLLLNWSNTSSAKQIGVDASVASKAKKALREAGLITLVRPGTREQDNDIYDVTALCASRRPE